MVGRIEDAESELGKEAIGKVKASLSEDVYVRFQRFVHEGLLKQGDFDLEALVHLANLGADLQDRVLTYLDNNRIYLVNSRSKSGFLVAACEKARKGSLDEKGFGATDPWREYLLRVARPKPLQISLVPETEWAEQVKGPQEFFIDASADSVGVPNFRIWLQLLQTVAEVKGKLADVGLMMPPSKMRLKEASVGFLRDERTLAFYNLKAGSTLLLVLKRRAGHRRRPSEEETA